MIGAEVGAVDYGWMLGGRVCVRETQQIYKLLEIQT